MCGEKFCAIRPQVVQAGSPPRVRGKESNAKTGQKARRITPACAGKRATPSKNPHPGGDHPRVCGEKYTCAAVRACRLGSPPRVRGKVARRGLAFSGFGITPACAGKRATPSKNPHPGGDHPRVCGEKQLGKNATDYTLGSPPRVRGKVSVDEVNVFHGGITPACAGKSGLCPPRSHKQAGSPPRVRGKVRPALWPSCWAWITPACAGKRLKRSHSIGHFSCILCLFHSVLHRASVSGGSRAGPCAPPCLPAQNAVPV